MFVLKSNNRNNLGFFHVIALVVVVVIIIIIPWLKEIIWVIQVLRRINILSWEGLLSATDVSTTCVVAIFRVKSHLTLRIASAYVVKTSVANNSPSQDSSHSDSDDLFQSRYVASGFIFNHFLVIVIVLICSWLSWYIPVFQEVGHSKWPKILGLITHPSICYYYYYYYYCF